jgi:hypothetical protein
MNMEFKSSGYKINISVNIGKPETDTQPQPVNIEFQYVPVICGTDNENDLEEQISQDALNHRIEINKEPEYPSEADKATLNAQLSTLNSEPDAEKDTDKSEINKTVDRGTEKTIPPQPTETVDNSAYQKLIKECVGLISELDSLKNRLETEEGKEMMKLTQDRLFEILIKSGALPVSDDPEFDILRHTAVSGVFVENGTPIKETVRQGIALGKQILIRAQVKV